ncbi:MAG TPA: hypothetical protein PKB06_02860 [Actinotalea sp.]|nr:hypothetical protein [Actinotalea sp.]
MTQPPEPSWQPPQGDQAGEPTPPAGWGQPEGTPGYGQPQYGQPPSYGQPQYGQPPSYGQPQYGQPPSYGQPQYGQPQYGQAGYGAPAGYQPAPVQPGIVPLRPLGLGEILDGAFRSIRDNPRVMFGLPAMVVAAGSVLGLILTYVLLPTMNTLFAGLFTGLDGGAELENVYALLSGASIGIIPVTFVSTTVLTGLLTASVSRSVIGQRISVGEVWRGFGRRALLLIPYSLVIGVVQLVGWSVLLLPGIGVMAAGEVGGGVLLVVAGLVGAGVLTVWFTVRTLLVPPAVVLEGRPLWATFLRGWRLSRGSFWRLLGIYLLTAIIVGFITQLISVPFGFVAGFITFLQNDFALVAVTLLSNALGLIISLAFVSPVVALLYIDVRMRREGLDIELARAAEAG